MHHIEGDGNCCFLALAFTLCVQKQEIQSVLPNLFSDVGIHIEAETIDIAYQLQLLAVNEWMQHTEDYQSFLDGNHTVSEEAPQFLQQGHFLGPRGNTMVLAVSNALGLPIIVFSSTNHSLSSDQYFTKSVVQFESPCTQHLINQVQATMMQCFSRRVHPTCILAVPGILTVI